MFCYDVIVIGTGPSGASAVYEMARTGARVLILERAKLPRYKTCGGAIPLNFFETLPARVQKTQEGLMERSLFIGPKNKKFEPQKSPKIAGVMRERFDHEFVRAACDEGAELIDDNPVIGVEERADRILVRTKRGVFESRFLVGADGSSGVVKRWVGLNRVRPFAAALEVEMKREDASVTSNLALIHFSIIRDGYAWVFPKGNMDSVGIASFNRDRQKVKQKLAEWLRLCGYRLNGEVIHGHPLPAWNGKAKLSTKRSLLVGDAAGTVDPLVGEGIRYGILSGRIAARFISEALKTDFISEQYTDAVYREIHSDFNYAKKIAAFFYRFPGFCFHMWGHAEVNAETMGKVLFGELSYRDIFQKVLKGLFNPKKYFRFVYRQVEMVIR